LWKALDFQLNELGNECVEQAKKYDGCRAYMEEHGGTTVEVGRKINTVGSLVVK